MPDIIKGDKTCSKCGNKYFSKSATNDMENNKLCFGCILEYYRFIFSTNKRPTMEEWKNAKKIK